MNSQMLKKLWVLADKLRGAFEVSELYKIMLYSLLFKYIELDKNNIEFYDEKFSLGYLSLTYGKLIHSDQIANYMIQIEKYYNLAPGVLVETIDTVLYKADADSIRILFEAMNDMILEEQSDLYEFAKAIVERISLQSGKAGTEYYSSDILVRLEKAILDTQDGMTVYDGYCGSGLSINEVSAGKGIVFMQDLSVQTIGVASILTLLSGNKIGAIRCGDSLQNPLLIKEKYDRIVIEAPFGVKYPPEYLMSIKPENAIYAEFFESETLGIRHAIAHLKEDGMAVVLVPMGILFRGGRLGDMRKILVEEGYIDSVIELPVGIIPSTMVTVALVTVKMDRKNDTIFMINAKDFFTKEKKSFSVTENSIIELVEILKNRKCVENVSAQVSIEELNENEYNLCTSQYVIANPENNIVVEDTQKLLEQYRQLEEQLQLIDKELDSVRARFV